MDITNDEIEYEEIETEVEVIYAVDFYLNGQMIFFKRESDALMNLWQAYLFQLDGDVLAQVVKDNWTILVDTNELPNFARVQRILLN